MAEENLKFLIFGEKTMKSELSLMILMIFLFFFFFRKDWQDIR